MREASRDTACFIVAWIKALRPAEYYFHPTQKLKWAPTCHTLGESILWVYTCIGWPDFHFNFFKCHKVS